MVITSTPNFFINKDHGGNTNFPTCAVDGAGTALSGCRSKNTAFDRAVRLSTEGVRFVGELLESNLEVFFNIFLSEFVVRHNLPRNSSGELFHRLFSRGEASNRKQKREKISKTCKIYDIWSTS